MPYKMQIIIEHYDPGEKSVEGIKIDKDGVASRFKEKGLKVDDFKKLLRKKFGDEVDIVNKVKKHRDMPTGERHEAGGGARGDGFSTKDIVELMKNKFSD